jgi:hypothetical protein
LNNLKRWIGTCGKEGFSPKCENLRQHSVDSRKKKPVASNVLSLEKNLSCLKYPLFGEKPVASNIAEGKKTLLPPISAFGKKLLPQISGVLRKNPVAAVISS